MNFFTKRSIQALFEPLEPRLLFAAQPVATVSAPGTALIGDHVTATVTFQNVPDGSAGGDVGYGPFIDVVIPTSGHDGHEPPNPHDDGLTLNGATAFGQSLPVTQVVFDANGNATHPFLKDSNGDPVVIHAADFGAQAGDTLAVISLPFGSFVPDQPAVAVQLDLTVSNLADANYPLNIVAQGGFQYGLDPLDNPTVDPPVLGPQSSAAVTPVVMELTKTNNYHEDETVSGPNFPGTYQIAVNIATGQTLDNLVVTDHLPDGIVVTGVSTSGNGNSTAVYDSATNTVTATFTGSVVGVAGNDSFINVNFYVQRFEAPTNPATPVLDPDTGAPTTITNTPASSADWTPLDTTDPVQHVNITGDPNVLNVKSIEIQKTVADVNDPTHDGVGPGDTLAWTVNGQVSDYFRFGGPLVFTDTLSDGQHLLTDGTHTPFLTLTENGVTTTQSLAGHYTSLRNADGTTSLSIDVAAALTALTGSGELTGGVVGGLAGGTTFVIGYYTLVDTDYANPANGVHVGQGDTLSNDAHITGGVIDNTTGLPTGGTPTDDSHAGITVVSGAFDKTIYEINGVAPTGAAPAIKAGDEVTFELKLTLPQSVVSDIVLSDFLPLPVFNISTVTFTFEDVVSADAPASGVVKWGPDAAAFRALFGNNVIVAQINAANELVLTFPDVFTTPSQSTVLDILFTATVQDRPFGDNLLLTNLGHATETNSVGDKTESDAIAFMTLTEPDLHITKGVVATDDPQGIFEGSVGPVSFSAPGSAGVRFSGVINSDELAATPVDANLLNIDGGDLVTFAVVVQNLGHGRDGAFDIQLSDIIPEGYAIPTTAAGLNLQVTDGAGHLLNYTFDLATASLTVIDPATGGALTRYDPTSGTNVLVITYDLQTTAAPGPLSSLINIAEITHYAAVEGGNDFTINDPASQLQDSALVQFGAESLAKTVVATSLPQTGSDQGNPALPDLAIGETVTFDVTVTLREEQIYNLVLSDLLPTAPGVLELLTADIVSIGGNLFTSDGNGNPVAPLTAPTAVITDTNGDGLADRVTFTFASPIVNVPDNLSTADDQIVLRVKAIVPDVAANVAGLTLTNTGQLTYDEPSGTHTDIATAAVEVVEPNTSLVKVANTSTVVNGDVVTYTLTLHDASGSFSQPAFDLALNDVLPDGLSLISGTIAASGSAAAPVIAETSTGFSLTLSELDQNETLTVTFQALVLSTVTAGQRYTNNATLDYYSMPDAPTGPDGVNRHYEDSASASVVVPGPSVLKTIYSTSNPDTGNNAFGNNIADLAIGETVTYEVVITVPRAVTQSLFLNDQIPIPIAGQPTTSGLLVLDTSSLEIVSTGGALTGPELANPILTLTDTNGDGIMDHVTYEFGSVTNTAISGAVTSAEQIVLHMSARLANVAANVNGDVLTNVATAVFTVDNHARISTSTAQVDVVEPDLGVQKIESARTGDAGDVVNYDVALTRRADNSGPAYDLLIDDPLPVGMTLNIGSVALNIDPSRYTILSGNTVGDTDIRILVASYLLTDPILHLTYSTTIDQSVTPGQVMTNTATLTYDSYPGVNPPEFERGYGPVQASTTFTVILPNTDKNVGFTSDPLTGTQYFRSNVPDLAIGEEVTYFVVVTLPESTTLASISDTLNLLNSSAHGPGVLTYVSSQVVAIGSQITGSLLAVGDAGSYDSATNTVTFNFGTLVNHADNVVTAGDRLVVEITGRLADVAGNQVGDQLTNTATLAYTGGTQSDTASVDVVGPTLDIAKTAATTAPADAGDEVTYTVTIAQDAASTGPAYLLHISDLLTANAVLEVGSVTASIGTVVLGNGVGDTSIEVDVARLAIGDAPITITYRARLTDAVQPGDVLSNTANLTYESQPSFGRESTGSATATLPVQMAPTLVKSIYSTDLPATSDPSLAQGETVTYQLLSTIREGTQHLVVTDALPTGLTPLSATVVSIGHITGSLLGAGSSGVINGQTVTFDFGDIVNPGDNVVNAGDQVVVLVTARVVDTTPAGTVLVDNGETTSANLAGTHTDNATSSVVNRVVAPDLVLTKTVLSYTPGDAGTPASFEIKLSHASDSTGPAFGTITDPLPVGLRDVTITGQSGPIQSATISGGVLTIVLADGGYLTTDAPIVVDIAGVLADNVENAVPVTNTATVAYRGSPTSTNITTVQASASVDPLLTNAFDKSLVSTSNPDTTGANVAIGEVATYSLAATIAEGTQHIVISDALPAGMSLIDATVQYDPSAITGAAYANGQVITITGTSLTLDFGVIVNHGDNNPANDGITVLVRARVLDVASNQSGTLLTDTGTLTPTNSDGTPVQPPLTDTATVEVVAPQLALQKTVVQNGSDAGAVATYTLVIHDVGSTGPAYDVTITDPLDPNLILVPGSLTASVGTVSESGGHITVVVPTFLPGAADITVTYQAVLADTVRNGQVIPNTATTTYDSLPGDDPDQREFTPLTSTANVDVAFTPELTKTITATSNPDTSENGSLGMPDVAPGETITYRLVATLGEGTQMVLVTDLLPANITPILASVISIGANISGYLTGAGTISGQTVTFNFGDNVVNHGDNVVDGRDQIVLEVVGRLQAAATPGAVLANQAHTTYDIGDNTGTANTPDVSAPVHVVTPVLDVVKTPSPELVHTGETTTYTVTVSHDATSTSAAYDITLADLLADSHLTLVAGSVTINGVTGTVTTGNANGDTTVSIALPRLLLGETAVISFQVTVVAPDATTIDNTATLNWDSAPGDTPGELDGSNQATATIALPPAITKALIATSLPETGTGQFNPSITDLAVGEVATWRITLTLPEVANQLLTLIDDLPWNTGVMRALTANIVSIGSNITLSGAPVITFADAHNADGILDQITIALGAATNLRDHASTAADQIVIDITSSVVDLPANAPGTLLTNLATLNYTIGGRDGSNDATAQAEVVLPDLTLDKTITEVTTLAGTERPPVNGQPVVQAGDTITYTVVVGNTQGTGPAYDILVSDGTLLGGIGEGLVLIPGSVTTSSGMVEQGDTAGDVDVRVRIPVLLPGETATITYRVTVAPDEPEITYVNTATANASTAAIDGIRQPDAGTQDATDSTTATLAVPALFKRITDTSLPDTGHNEFNPLLPDLAVGETVTYTLNAFVPDGPSTLKVTDLLPSGAGIVDLVSAQVVSIGANIAAPAVQPQLIDSDGDGRVDTIVFDFGRIYNTPDGEVNAKDEIVFQIVGRVANVPGNVAGTELTNTATLVSTGIGGEITLHDQASAEVVEPALTVSKTVDHTSGNAGDVFTYRLTITQLPSATSPAYDVVLSDPLNPGLVLDPASITTTEGTVSVVDGGVRITLPIYRLGELPVVVTYQAHLADSVRDQQVVPNTATLGWDSAPGGYGRADADQASASVLATFQPTVAKVVYDTTYSVIGSAQYNPAYPDVLPTDVVTYHLTVTLGEGTSSVVVMDDLPVAGGAMQYLSSRVLSIGGSIGNTALHVGDGGVYDGAGHLVFNFGGAVVNHGDNVVNDGDRIVIEVRAVVMPEAAFTPGVALINRARVDFGTGITPDATAGVDPIAIGPTPGAAVPAGQGYGFSFPHYEPAAPTMLTGTASPASTVVVALQDSSGRILGYQSALADAGGNWLARFQPVPRPTPDLPTTDDYFAGTRLFADLVPERLPRAWASQAPEPDLLPHLPVNAIVWTTPSSVMSAIGENTRVTYAAGSPGGFFATGAAAMLEEATDMAHALAGDTDLIGLGWNKFMAEYLSSALPGGTLR